MKINENHRYIAESETVQVDYIDHYGHARTHEYQAMGETIMEIWVNGQRVGVVPCTPEHLPELVVGWLRHAGYLQSNKDSIEILLEDGDEELGHYLIARCSLADPQEKSQKQVQTDEELLREWQWLYDLKEQFEKERPLRKETKATHSCMLVQITDGQSTVLFQSEDAGRHSAMDKAIGWGIINGVDLAECVLFTSGRISGIMTDKAAAAGVKALTTGKPLVSTEAILIAKRHQMILAGLDENENVILFSGK